jgi:translocator protein
MEDRSVTGLVGVYDADGGLLGEAAYVWGKVRGTRHCALCHITHGRVRRRHEWDQMVAGLGIPVDLLHLNEMPPDVVFGIMWPLNFLALLGVGVWFTRSTVSTDVWRATLVLAASVVAALAWAWLFYVPHRIGAATVTLAVAAVLTWVLLALVARSLPWAGGVLAPYAVWLSVATALSVGYGRLN